MKRINSKINLDTAASRAKFISDHDPGSYVGRSAPDTAVYITVEPNGDMVVSRIKANSVRSHDKVTYNREGMIKYVETEE
ncbi:MAG: hypothetical protein LBC69_01650 [Eubacteriaceae bacterium]|jgi:hypothetical protein|nr:hypothetical protein [Eubacteriaceae bacterium]